AARRDHHVAGCVDPEVAAAPGADVVHFSGVGDRPATRNSGGCSHLACGPPSGITLPTTLARAVRKKEAIPRFRPREDGPGMHRRRFLKTALKATGYGLGAGLVGGAGLIAWVQPRRHRLPVSDGNEARPARATVRRRVVVVGGGLAGLVAGLALQDRN